MKIDKIIHLRPQIGDNHIYNHRSDNVVNGYTAPFKYFNEEKAYQKAIGGNLKDKCDITGFLPGSKDLSPVQCEVNQGNNGQNNHLGPTFG
jgi:hypothetical protein